jgi:peptide/nickel transport system substrate-binding protein
MPSVKRLVYKSVLESTTRMAMLKRGEVDVAYLLDVPQAQEVKRDPNLKLAFSGGIAVFFLDFLDQWDPKSPWHDRRVRLAANYAIDRQALSEAETLGASKPAGNHVPPTFEFALPIEPYPYDPAKAKQLLAEAGYPNGFEVTMNLTAWPGRGYLPDVGEAVATYWEKVGIKVKRRPLDRAVFSADFRARAYSGVTLAYATPLVAPEPWEALIRGGHTKAALNLFVEHPKLDEFVDRLATEANYKERVRIMRDELGPWLQEYVPGVAIGAAHAIAGVGPKVGDWPLIPGHMGFHNWEYVSHATK